MRVPLTISTLSPVLERRTGGDSSGGVDATAYLAEGVPVRVFERGADVETDTPVDVYSAEEGGVVLAQPLRTDRAGRVEGQDGEEVWVDAGSYDVLVADSVAPWETGATKAEIDAAIAGDLTPTDLAKIKEEAEVAPWAPSHAYPAGRVVSQSGQIWKAAWAHTSGATFNPNNWVALDLPYGPFLNPYPGKIGFATNMRSRTAERRKRTAERAASIGVAEVREVMSWTEIQPTNSASFTWTTPDAVFKVCAENGLTILPVLTGTPYWATRSTDYNVPPINNSDYANFALAVWERYGPAGTFWKANPSLTEKAISWVELWNEPWLGAGASKVVFAVNTIKLGAASAGTFTLKIEWQGKTFTTAAIKYNPSNAEVQAAANAAKTGGGEELPENAFVASEGTLPETQVKLTAQRSMTGPVVITINGGGLTGATLTAAVTTAGVAPDLNTGFFHATGENGPTWESGGPDAVKYAAMCKAVGTLLREKAPAAKILIAGEYYYIDSAVLTKKFLEPLLAAETTLISGNLFDGITLHPYVVGREHGPYEQDGQGATGALLDPQGRFDRIRLSQRLLDTKGATGKEVWMTEMGWATDLNSGLSNSEDLQAEFTVNALRRVFREYGASGESNPATRAFIYTLDDYLAAEAGTNDNNVLKWPGEAGKPATAKRVVPALRKLLVAGDGLRRLQEEMLADGPCFMLSLAEPSGTLRDLAGLMPVPNPLAATSGLINSPAAINETPGPQFQGVPGTDLTFGGPSLISDPRAYSLQFNTGAGGILIDDHPALNVPTTQLALTAWVKVAAISGTSTIFRKYRQYQLTVAKAGTGYGATFGAYGGGAVPHVESMTAGSRTTGEGIISFIWNGVTYTSAAIPWNATAKQIAYALNLGASSEGLTLPGGAFRATGGPIGNGGSTVTITAPGLPGRLSSWTVAGSTWTGGSGPVLTQTTEGELGTNSLMSTNESTESMALGSVHQIFGVWDGNLMKIYVDGKRSVQAPVPLVGSIAASAQPLGLGYRGAAVTEFLKGNFSHMGIYPHAVSPRRIAEQYQAGVAAYALA